MQIRRTGATARLIASTLIAAGALTAGTAVLAAQPVFADDVPAASPSPLPTPTPPAPKPTGGATEDTPGTNLGTYFLPRGPGGRRGHRKRAAGDTGLRPFRIARYWAVTNVGIYATNVA